jgi:hypothetical protein
MVNILRIAVAEGYIFLFALLAIIALRLLTGDIRTRGLIQGRTATGSRFVSAGRVQLLIATLAAAAQYLTQASQSQQKLPEVPREWLLLLGGSQVLYLGTKFHGKRSRRFHI